MRILLNWALFGSMVYLTKHRDCHDICLQKACISLQMEWKLKWWCLTSLHRITAERYTIQTRRRSLKGHSASIWYSVHPSKTSHVAQAWTLIATLVPLCGKQTSPFCHSSKFPPSVFLVDLCTTNLSPFYSAGITVLHGTRCFSYFSVASKTLSKYELCRGWVKWDWLMEAQCRLWAWYPFTVYGHQCLEIMHYKQGCYVEHTVIWNNGEVLLFSLLPFSLWDAHYLLTVDPNLTRLQAGQKLRSLNFAFCKWRPTLCRTRITAL